MGAVQLTLYARRRVTDRIKVLYVRSTGRRQQPIAFQALASTNAIIESMDATIRREKAGTIVSKQYSTVH